MDIQHFDPILQIMAGLKTSYNEAILELEQCRKMLNDQNTNILALKSEIDNKNLQISVMQNKISQLMEDYMRDTQKAV